jgi:propionyl-CoA carboxylase alpha chain
MTIRRLLVANRGEIARRVFRTCRDLGIETVAVHSDADAGLPFVGEADLAVRLPGNSPTETYLRGDLVVEAALRAGADAVHPGYGFLSENAGFARQVIEAGLTWVGPRPESIEQMGSKVEAKKLVAAADVPVLGEVGPDDVTEDDLPLLVKASAGGGGRGMRVVRDLADVAAQVVQAADEAASAFGDPTVFCEPYVEHGRHVEVQVLGDAHGGVLVLGDRDCSLQRRHQKVVEEAPSPFVTPKMRQAMGEQCVALAQAVGYHSAGTVELIVSGADPSGESFYFLEMNTRLQVEHPVTEAVTGIDLVEQMIRVAAGEKLAFSQDDVRLDGWAIETRVYAEDPYRHFLPSTGRLVRYDPPEAKFHQAPFRSSPSSPGEERAYIRLDDGVAEGVEVSRFYDPMIAKLITWAPSREEAAALQVAALDEFRIEGLGHNVDFLSAIMQHPRFLAGELTTGFIAEEWPEGFQGAPTSEESLRAIAAVAAGIECTSRARAARTSGKLDGAPPNMSDWVVKMNGADHAVTLGEGHAMVDGHRVEGTCDWQPGRAKATATAGNARLGLIVRKDGAHWRITTHGAAHRALVLPAKIAPLARHMLEKVPPDLSKFLICPMPGLLVSLNVGAGDKVEPGQPLATVEAMKMENILRAQKTGTVKEVRAAKGDSLAVDQVILELE